VNVRDLSILSNGGLTLDATSGSVRLSGENSLGRNSQAVVSVVSGSASLAIAEMRQCRLDATVTSGGFVLENGLVQDSDVTVDIESGGADIGTGVISGAGTVFDIAATSGGVRFATATANSVFFDLKARSGGVSIDPRYGDHDGSFIMNGSQNTVKIRTVSGGIRLD
jgi:hypothetical protein